MATKRADFLLADHGSIFLLEPITDAARAWVEEHLPLEEVTRWGPSIVVEHRHIRDLVFVIVADGLEVR